MYVAGGGGDRSGGDSALWYRTAMNRNLITRPLARPFARSLTPLTHFPAPHCLLCSRALLRSFIRLLAHSLTPEPVGKGNDSMSQYHALLNHSVAALVMEAAPWVRRLPFSGFL